MRIIPAIDLLEGKCVRLTQGNYEKKTIYHENPLEMAKIFEDNGLEYLHLVDLEGAKASKVVHYHVLEQICSKTKLKVDFSGGIKSEEDLKKVINSGANQACIGSLAAKNPEIFIEWLQKYGENQIVLSADVKHEKIVVQGWIEKTEWNIYEFLRKFIPHQLKYVICTDVAKDGTLSGPSYELYHQIYKKLPEIHLVASGGIHHEKDLEGLKNLGCEGVIIGKAIYESKISIKNLKNYA